MERGLIMKMKSWARYFIYIFLILVMVFWGQHVFQVIETNRRNSFNPQYYYTSAMTIIFYGSIGLILGLEHLICEIKKEGIWILNLPKIILMGLPSLYFSLAYLTFSSNIQFLRDILVYPIVVLMERYSGFLSVFPLILGYSIITSFYKHDEKMAI
jgi:hypothetical protein